jgi:SpoIIAA-like
VERPIKGHGKSSMLVELHSFHGYSSGTLWKDITFDLKHFRDIE